MTPLIVQKVPLLDISRQEKPILPELNEAVQKVLASGMYVLGPETLRLEQNLMQYTQAQYAVACASGSEALLMALMACDLKPGDEVIVPSFTFFATASAVARLGGIPIFADINPDTWNLDAADAARKITARTKAIIPVHLFGQTADMDAIQDLADAHHLVVIEDAAQSIGAEYYNKKLQKSVRAGTLGHIGCFSFYPTKNLGACGDGGALTTNDDILSDKLRKLRNHGMEPRYYHNIIGINGRLDAFQAAVLNVKFSYLDTWCAQRQKNAMLYHELFTAAGLTEKIQLPAYPKTGRHVWNQYSICIPDGKRDALRDFLSSKNIGTEIYYPMGLHEQECFQYLKCSDAELPVTHKVSRSIMAIPIFPGITYEEQAYIVDAISEFYVKS
ncbi:MAG: DegT/DnrJ/EryC1/StrS family aminotransferase [Planctomycetia bacterium]|nr:DegT/DnrJ/EryC1/StrS family aminotransferase [Planctomycetia bacterium]